ncbi:MAG: hypothetical protein R3C45_19975 [Phycisphaerales bacterium]
MPETVKPRPRWTSRKFILAVSAQLTSMIVLFWPGHESAIVEASTSITSLVVILVTSLGYVAAEASLDARNTPAPDQETPAP